MQCPDCKGLGMFQTFHPRAIGCPFCEGTGEITGYTHDPERGRKLRDRRIRLQLGLRAYCVANGLDAHERSLNERGYFRARD